MNTYRAHIAFTDPTDPDAWLQGYLVGVRARSAAGAFRALARRLQHALEPKSYQRVRITLDRLSPDDEH